MNPYFDDDQLQGTFEGVIDPPRKRPGLADALLRVNLPTMAPGLPLPINTGIPGGTVAFSKALAGLQSSATAAPAAADEAAAPVRAGIFGPAVSKSEFDLDKATQYLDEHALPAYDKERAGHCARAVRVAIGAGGREVANTEEAKDYGPKLVDAGYTRLDANTRKNYTPQKGDVIIYPALLPDHEHGHMEMYDGKQWVSDFKQKGPIPYGDGTLHYEIYRP